MKEKNIFLDGTVASVSNGALGLIMANFAAIRLVLWLFYVLVIFSDR